MINNIEEKLNILRMVYKNIEYVDSLEIFKYKSNNEIVFLDINGNELFRGQEDKFYTCSNYQVSYLLKDNYLILTALDVITKRSNSYKLHIQSFGSNVEVTIKSCAELTYLILNVKIGYSKISAYIFKIDSNFNFICLLGKEFNFPANIFDIELSKNNNRFLLFKYTTHMYYKHNIKTIVVDKLTNKILRYDLETIENSEIGIAATSFNVVDNQIIFKYKLFKYGNTLGNTEYDKILYNNVIKDTSNNKEYYQVYNHKYLKDFYNDDNKQYGLIDSNGNEIIKAIARDLLYINNGMWLVNLNSNKGEYDNLIINEKIIDSNIHRIYPHKTLPIAIIHFKDNEYKIIDYRNGSIINFSDFSKAFECELSSIDNTALRVKLVYSNNIVRYKYIKTNFSNIESRLEIERLNKGSWINI